MLDEAIRLAECGFSVIWLKPRSKAPREAKWSTLPTLTVEELEESYQKGFNAGVRLGKHSKIGKKYLHAVDMDIRDENYTEIAKKIVKRTFELDLDDYPTVLSGSGGDSRHFYLLLDEPVASTKLWHSDEKMVDDEGKEHWCAEVELFGTGKQVVLPPSIHPDTGKRYAWAKEFDDRDLPVIDMDLVRAATEADEYEDADNDEPLGMTADEVARAIAKLQPWADDHDTWRDVGMAVKHELGMKDGWPVFDEWSKRGRGYNKGENRNQFLRFKNDRKRKITMRSIMAEVNREEAAIAADEFLEETKADAVIEPKHEPNMLPKAVAFSILDEECGRVERPVDPMRGIPRHLLSVPGRLAHAVDHYNATAASPQPQFAVQAALALGSVVLGRFHCTDLQNYTSLYFVNLAPTGAGKEAIRGYIGKVLQESKVLPLLGPSQYASEAAVLSELKFYPRHLAIIDEFGKLLGSSKKSQNTNALDAQTALISIFGQTDGMVRAKAYSANGKSQNQIAAEKTFVLRPAVTMVGLSTPETFFDALSESDVADGFMNRLLVVNSRMPIKDTLPKRWKKTPPLLRKWIAEYVLPPELQGFMERDPIADKESALNPLGEEPDNVDDPLETPFTTKARRKIDEIGKWIETERNRMLGEGNLQGLLARAKEITMKVSLIVALSCRSRVVNEDHLSWAWDYVRFYTMETVANAKRLLGSTPVVKAAEQIADLILDENRYPKGMTMSNMMQFNAFFRTANQRDRMEVVNQLMLAHEIEKLEVKGDRGPASDRYMHKGLAKELRERSDSKRKRRLDEDLA